jgi:Protein of unknown function (DUF1549)/Protein of unknown function (DUF1553)
MLRHSALVLAVGATLAAVSGRSAEPAGADDAQALAARIDEHLAARWATAGVKPAAPADDAEFLRRVYLDLAGRIPSVAEARKFLDDRAPDKRRRLVEQLLDGPDYVNHFTNIWRALLLPEANADPDGQRAGNGFDAWLRKQIADNVGHDRLVRELLTVPFAPGRSPAAAPEGPADGATPAGYYLIKDVKPENLAAGTARLFLGIRLECAQCHHHPFARWKREQFWGYAAFFAGIQRQNLGEAGSVVREVFDRREMKIPGSEQVVPAAFLDGREPRWRFKTSARTTLAEWMTAPDNPFFARAFANRTWAHFFGTGIVEPVDDLEGQSQPSHPELLDELARQFAGHGFDRKFLIRAVTASRAYQLSSRKTDDSQDDARHFARAAVRGLSPRQVADSLALATGWKESEGAQTGEGMSSLRAEILSRFADAADQPAEARTSIPQALMLMNGRFTSAVTGPKAGGTFAAVADDRSLDTAGRVETLFLATLSRRPTAQESARLVKYVDEGGPAKDPRRALADVFWALLNSGEFLLNH